MKKIIILLISFLSIALYAQVPLTPWSAQGPNLFPINASGQINGIGRISQVKFNATDTSTMYAVSASGGIYYSTNLGTTWHVYGGSELLPRQSLASICVDRANNNTIYIGSGDANYYSSGTGVWKSTNGGTSFVLKNTGMGNRLVIELLQFNTNLHHFIAATNNGIYKSTDTTNNWVLKSTAGLRFTDMEFKPGTNGRVIYASTLDSVYRSTDFGETWITLKDNGYYIPAGAGGGQGVRVAVCASDTNILYVAMVKNYGTIFKSTNGGNTFTVMKDTVMPNLTGYSNTLGDAGQGNYNFDINCEPNNPNVLFLVSHNVWKSTTSGSTWTQLTNWYAVVHTDMHQVAFSPHNPIRHYNVNDGGIWYTQNSGSSWVQKSDSLGATEVSPAACSNLDRNYISIGTQDNGELYRDASGWKTNRGGDWYNNMAYDWKNPTTVYYAKGARRVVSGGEQTLSFPFTGDATLFAFNSKSTECAIIAKKDSVWMTKNLSSNPPTWQLVDTFVHDVMCVGWSTTDTNKLFVVTKNAKVYRTDNLYAATPAFIFYTAPGSTNTAAAITTIANKDSVLYLSCGNRIYRSQNYGSAWTNISSNYPTINVISLYHDPYTVDESVYAAGNLATYYHKDTMTTWQSLVQNLPTIASLTRQMAFNDGSSNAQLRVSYYGKGIWSIPIQTNKVPSINFSADTTLFCSGQVVHFYDSTINSPTSWTWSFPGGIPSSSTLRNPVVTYSTAGIYNVTLTATNSVGSNTLTRNAYIRVINDSIPVNETFETSILPTNWQNIDVQNDNEKWEYFNGASGFGVGTKSYRFDNYNLDSRPFRDALMTTKYNFYPYDSVWLSFDRAHAPYSGANRDSLEVVVAGNCGSTYTRVWMKGYLELATAPALTASTFIPTASQWKKDTINLSAYAGQIGVSLQFKNLPGFGQTIYIDNINIWGKKTPPIANAGRDTSFCSGFSARIGMSPQALVRYEWTPSSGLSSDTISNPLATPTSTTSYVLKATSTRNNLITYDTVVITVNPLPIANAGNDTALCVGRSASIGATTVAGMAYLWSPNTNISSTSIANPTINVLSNINYILRTTNTITSCVNYDTIRIIANGSSSGSFNQSICSGTVYFFNGFNRSSAGTYLDTLIASTGCDSFLTLNLSVRPTSSASISQSICAGNSYLFNGINRTSAGIYLDTLTAFNGCDSFLTLNLSVRPTSSATITQSICAGNSYLFNGILRTSAGTYLDTLIASNGCDSFLTLNLSIRLSSSATITQSICAGTSYLFNGINRTSAGTYLDTLIASNGCDSFLTLNLSIRPTSSASISQSICAGTSYLFNGINRTSAGTYLDTLIASNGCDSFLTLNLSIRPTSSTSINQSICFGTSYFFNGINRNSSGTYFDTLISSTLCDSFLSLHLTVLPAINTTINQTICAGSSYLFNDVLRSSTGTYLDTLVASSSCDSIISLHLVVSPILTSTINQTICIGASYLFNGVLRTSSGTYLDTLSSIAACDSFVTLNLITITCGSTPPSNDNRCLPMNLNRSIASTTPYSAASYADINTHTDTIYQSNTLASMQVGEAIGSCGSSGLSNKTLWYMLTAPSCATPKIHISTDERASTDFDTRISVYRRTIPTSCSSIYNEIACNDNGTFYLNTGATSNSSIVLTPNTSSPSVGQYLPGENLYIQTSGVANLSGNYGLIIDVEPYIPVVSALGGATATLNWDTAYTATWGAISGTYLQWRPVGSSATTAGSYRYVAGPSSNSTLTGLIPGTAYEYWASYVCGNGGRWYSKKGYFTTSPACASAPLSAPSVSGGPSACAIATVSFVASVDYTSYRLKRRIVGRSTVSTSPIFYPAPGTQVYNWTGSLSTAYEFWIEAYCGTSLAATSPITLYTSCGTARMQNPESNATDNDIAIRMPNGDIVYGLAANMWASTTDMSNPNEQEITLESMSAATFFALDENENHLQTTHFDFTIYPNPAYFETSINYNLAQTNESIIISLLDAQGKELSKETITNPSRSGKYSFNLNNYSAGIYFIKVQAGTETQTKKLILDKR